MQSTLFREKVDLTGTIRSILNNYPFSVGIIRELLQNSDDARATKQVIVLDRRIHPSEFLYHPNLAKSQGPALLAFNNALFEDHDWEALQNISRSSKREDTSKIGKFGIGIRSCYHVTDYLQIMSGDSLVIFDPLRTFSDDGGVRIKLTSDCTNIRDHFRTFGHFVGDNYEGGPFNGTILRLPLRNTPGEIRDRIVTPQEISQLLLDFVEAEINMSMLYLQNLRCIEVLEINENGEISQIGACTITSEVLADGVSKKVTKVTSDLAEKEESWLIINSSSPDDEAIALLSARAGGLGDQVLKRHKLRSDVGLAFPIDNVGRNSGQLFTYLRLPLATGFPAHVHAFFALTPSRQNLRNHGDHGIVKGSDDSVLIEWNKLLFEVFIPRTWSKLLNVLVQKEMCKYIFAAWPVAQSFTQCGESVYWNSFPRNLLCYVIEDNAPVWPVFGTSGPIHRRLDSVFIAMPDTSSKLIESLSAIGLEIACPPGYIIDMLKSQPQSKHMILTPESASQALRTNFLNILRDPQVQRTVDCRIILDYLLSSQRLDNIIDLPIVPIISGGFVPLSSRGTTLATHTLLEEGDFNLFQSCDQRAIALHSVSSATADLFRRFGPSILNVKHLDPSRVIEYLALHPSRLGLDLSLVRTDLQAVAFLSSFWTWFDSWVDKNELWPKLRPLYLVPCSRGLKQANEPVFIGVDPDPLSAHLTTLGVPFLDANIAPAAAGVLKKHQLLKSIEDIHAVLDSLCDSNLEIDLPQDGAQILLRHFSTHANGPFNQEQRRLLRRLPIFPVVSHTVIGVSVSVTTRWTSLKQRRLHGVSSLAILAAIPDTCFIDTNLFDPRILPSLDAVSRVPLTDLTALELGLQHLHQQPQPVLAHILNHISAQKHRLTMDLRNRLKREVFVSAADGSMKSPHQLIDPFTSPMYPLYFYALDRIPRTSNVIDRQIATALSTLRLMDYTMSSENVMEQINFISSNASEPVVRKVALQLLKIIDNQGFNCNALHIRPTQIWLPTRPNQMATSSTCRPRPDSQEKLFLFDRVLELLDPDAIVSSSLHKALRWDVPIPVSTLIEQFRQVLKAEENTYQRVVILLTELSRRGFQFDEMVELQSVVSGQSWVPTSRYSLVKAPFAVFSGFIPEAGVHEIAPVLRLDSQAASLLRRLGCTEEPSFDTIVLCLSELKTQYPTNSISTHAVSLLKFVVSKPLLEEERQRLLIPDDGHRLRSISEVVFNDIGNRAILVQHRSNCFLAHSLIDDDLAKALKLDRLGLKFVHLQSSSEDMGATPVTLVRTTLRQYAEKQFLPEFLANAEDAGATRFSLLLNEYVAPGGNLLSPSMEKFYNCPSLLIYNDSVFSDKDFAGICRTHIGGKAGDPHSIGQFGLGALTMFHITELAIIISGSQVLFLDPSKTHLPLEDRASLQLPLTDLTQFYPGHLAPLLDLDWFKLDSAGSFPGTIFMLPFRNASHCARNPISRNFYDSSSFKARILDDFERKAAECLLFLKVSQIEARSRRHLSTAELWLFAAHREITTSDDFSKAKTVIGARKALRVSHTQTWLTVSSTIPPLDVPEEYRSEGLKHLRVGLAAFLDDQGRDRDKQCNFFSTLPLAIPTSLPVHVNASFILSTDRRQIRHDAHDSKETRLNRWLLSDCLPPVYIGLLEEIAKDRDNERWWPGRLGSSSRIVEDESDPMTTTQEDSLTTTLIDSFYSTYLPKTSRHIFCSMYPDQSDRSMTVKVDEAIFFAKVNPAVTKAFSILRPPQLVELSRRVTRKATESGFSSITPGFVKNVLLLRSGAARIRETLSSNELQELISYLVQPDATNLCGLPLLCLQSNDWVNFEPRTQRAQTYYLWKNAGTSSFETLFPPWQLIHPAFFTEELLAKLVEGGMNVAPLSAAAVKSLVEGHLRNNPVNLQEWIRIFWKAFPFLPQEDLLESIENIPLVPTLKPGFYVSLEACKAADVMLPGSTNNMALECVQDLGIPVVCRDECPNSLRRILRSSEYETERTILIQFLHAIKQTIATVVRLLRSWSWERQSLFAEWLRSLIWGNTVPEDVRDIARQLPIWPAVQGASTSLQPATSVTLLPYGIDANEAARFLEIFASVDQGAHYLGVERLTLPQFSGLLRLPPTLDDMEEVIYKRILDVYLALRQPYESPVPVRVPNTNRVVVLSDTLYASEPLFVAAFGTSSEHFLLPSFRSLEAQLLERGLQHRRQLDMNMFMRCAQAFHNDQARDKVQRAHELFRVYSEELPVLIPPSMAFVWHCVDNLRFIPRNMNTTMQFQSNRLALPPRVQNLPAIVSPREVLQTKFHAIAWTQRASLSPEPNERILVAYPEFGQPTVAEVVEHLRELSHMRAGSDTVHYLTETYTWLCSHAPEAGPILRQYGEEAIFLNVDDPGTEDWRWTAARQMAFETHDVEHVHGVRQFLSPYKTLLLAAGVVDVVYPRVDAESFEISDQELLRSMRLGFAKMRANGDFTDVTFVSKEDVAALGAPDEEQCCFVGHRVFLSVFSAYFKDMFDGSFIEGQPGPTRIVMDNSRSAIKSVLDYFYTGDVISYADPDNSLEDLLQVMELSHYLDVRSLFMNVQIEIARREMIDPTTLQQIRQRAQAVDADRLITICNEYEALNPEYIHMLNRG